MDAPCAYPAFLAEAANAGPARRPLCNSFTPPQILPLRKPFQFKVWAADVAANVLFPSSILIVYFITIKP
jgi:hypothetical protein